MIDPRNMPYARVCLSRLSPRELPPNALQQYHNYAAKRKSSDPVLIEAKDITGQHPAVNYSFVSGVTDQRDTGVNAINVAHNIHRTGTCAQSSPLNYLYVPEVNHHLSSRFNSLNMAKETIGTGMCDQHPFVNYPCTTGVVDHLCTGVNALKKIRNTNEADMPVQHPPVNYSSVVSDKVDVKAVDVQPCRRNSAILSSSSSSSHSSTKGRELIASVRLSPVTWDRPKRTKRRNVNCKRNTEDGGSDEAMSDFTDNSSLSGTKSMCELNLEPQGFLYEEMPPVTLSSSPDASEPLSDESTHSAGFTSFKDHVMYGCEDVWPDFNSYSPPESPGLQNTDISKGNEILSPEAEKVLAMEAETVAPLETDVFIKVEMEQPNKPAKSEKTDGFLCSLKSEVRHLSMGQSGLLSPEIKLVPLNKNENSHGKRRLSCSYASPLKRKSLSPKGDLVVKLNDVGDKLKPSTSGGITIAKAGRCTTSGRRILANYSEKSLAESVMKVAPTTEVKNRRARNKAAKCSVHLKRNQCACNVENRSSQKGRKRKRKPMDPALRYENLKLKELNTIPRISTRYKVAFTKWPYVFTGALDLINQRLSNQNAFWNSIRS